MKTNVFTYLLVPVYLTKKVVDLCTFKNVTRHAKTSHLGRY